VGAAVFVALIALALPVAAFLSASAASQRIELWHARLAGMEEAAERARRELRA